jgi:arabinofuranan 3-O-arabinosyltransferase
VHVGAGPATVLVVHENSNAGWRATLGGQVLRAVVVDGWQQGWVVPAGAAGAVHLTYTPGRSYRVGLLVGVAGLLALAWLVLRGGGRPGPAVGLVVHRTPRAALVISAGLLVLMGGPAGALALVVAAALGYFLPRRDVPAVVLGATVLLLTGLAQHAPWPGGRGLQSAVAQVAVLLSVAVALFSASDDRDRSADAPPADS